ncbi:unnamed protein product [Penicillium salamii]|uniref:Uncharacterized protein n=1 Tax=Penicillium salamii TaxID=1612424 RepID=A0A9W4IER0_9EURO|nr:unnamed protein product [Penicillium salamii]CAG7935715.1 unnamed protein product [Penicillium salamii]CAG7947539.1 unnamed protein product [Penicillium salamii]CAG7948393.1 unnamed protein product [Penicillium salamii]CAG7948990.1 unnamed protein product [Penicillium salamii]
MSKSSNERRFKLRKQCREALAAHIYDRLRLVVAPERVRLQPRPEDGYAWSVARTNANLLKSSLSSGSTRLYQVICRELGHSLEAVNPQSLDTSQFDTGDLPEDFSEGIVDGSFAAEIRELKATNSRTEEELGRTRSRLDDCLRQNHTLRTEANELRHDIQMLGSQNKDLHDELVQKTMGIAGAIQTLSSLETERIEITPDTHGTQSSAIGMLSVAGEV